MKPRFHSLASRVAPLFGLTVFCSLQTLHAASGVWTGVTSGSNWSDTANWSGGTVADGSGSLADFSTLDLPAGTFTVNLDSARTIGSLSFNDTDTTTAGTWQVSGTNTLTLDGSPVITTTSNANVLCTLAGTSFTKQGAGSLFLDKVNTISGTVNLNAGQIAVREGAALGASTNVLAMAGGTTFRMVNISSSVSVFPGYPINVAASSSVTMTSAAAGNGYGGLVTGDANSVFNIGAPGAVVQVSVNRASTSAPGQQFLNFLGRVEINDGASIRFSATNLNNGGESTLWDTNASGTITTRNQGTMHLGNITGNGTITMGTSGNNNNWVTYNIGNRGDASTYGGRIIDGDTANGKRVAINKVGGGTLKLTNTTDLTYSGTTNVNGGTLVMNGVKSGTGATNVNDGGTLSGTGSLAGSTTVANGGILAPGDDGVGNMTFANLSLASGSILALQFGTGNDSVTVQSGGVLTLTNGATVDVGGFNTSGTYPIFNVAGATVSGTPAAALSVVNGDPGKIYSFSSDSSAVYLNISDTDPSNYWNVDGSGAWGTASNWTKNLVPNAPGANAKVGPGVGGAGGSFTPTSLTIDLDAVRTVGEIVLNDDFGTTFTIAPGISGSLLMDNNAAISNVVVAKGSHSITAPIAVDAEDVSFDVGDLLNLEASGVISSSASGGGVVKSGPGTLRLTGTNTYDGGTTMFAGALAISNASSLGDVAVPAVFTGGTLRILNDLTDARSYQVSGASNAVIDTNAFNYTYGGVIAPAGGGTGGLTKTGAGTLTLTGVQTYTGTTTQSGGNLVLSTGGSISGSAMNVTAGTFTVAGGTLTASATSSVTSAGFALSSGSASFAALNGNNGNPSTNIFINLTGGTFSASSLTMGRCAPTILSPTAGSTTAGLYVNGATASVTGALSVGMNSSSTNSSVSARIDSGSLTVGGVVQIAIASPDRWSVLDVNGGTFTSTDTVTGVQVGSGQGGGVAFLVRNGTATAERIILQQPAASTRTSLLNLSGGSLYIGAGGIVGNNNAGTGVIDVQLGAATLGAKASWTSAVAATLNGTTTIKAADALDAPFDITLSGALSGAGGFDKTGAGTLTLSGANTYGGTTNITAGKLVIAGDQSGATGDVTTVTGTTLGGNGNIGGNVTIASGATHQIAVAATAAAQVTRVITGSLTLAGGDIVDLTAAATPAAGSYTLVTATGGITGTLATSTINYNGITGTLNIVGGNSLVLTVTGSGYASWASTKGLTAGVNDGPTDDPDFDGVDNALEFVLGGEPLTSDPSILPDLAVNATDFVFTFNRSDESEAEIALTFQHGNNLSSWTDVAIGAAGAGVVAVAENDTAPDLITVTIPKGSNTSLFGRLRAVK